METLVLDVLLLQGCRHQLLQTIRRDFSHFFSGMRPRARA